MYRHGLGLGWPLCGLSPLDIGGIKKLSKKVNRQTQGAVSDNLAKAMSLLDESLAISSKLGMRPVTERVPSRREILRP